MLQLLLLLVLVLLVLLLMVLLLMVLARGCSFVRGCFACHVFQPSCAQRREGVSEWVSE